MVIYGFLGDIGKPNTKLEKAKVNDGVCRWENRVFETVNFVQEPKTGRFIERVYHFVLSMGLSKASSIGDVYVGDIRKPSTKLEKAKVNDGVCRWENPVFETVKFVQEPKNGRLNERVYHFVLCHNVIKSCNDQSQYSLKRHRDIEGSPLFTGCR
ncbi:hypothetical protein RIF29_24389 [Crotalaria pallida]|uniref:C2 NT-type domain-containing protein n=1 Tax=Crotalaria pallida TaxID=3830 RepID=A0AAN9HYE6_CROPI